MNVGMFGRNRVVRLPEDTQPPSNMPFQSTPLAGLTLFDPIVIGDERGYFYESYNERDFKAAGISARFVQDNQAFSSRGVCRGLHYQLAPYTQAKLVRVIEGSVLDVVVDLRLDSMTYGQSYSCVLSGENQRQLFVPKGFAHGYVVLSQTAVFFYKCDDYYKRSHEAGIHPLSPSLEIDWECDLSEAILAERDLNWPFFGEHLDPSSGMKVSRHSGR
jgi:dTDP-4-dehydrorhamnose 3,5-epimerase